MTKQKPKTVLVTGAEGALGRVVAGKFSAEGFSVFGTHLPSVAASALPAVSGIRWVPVDVTAAASVRAMFGTGQGKVSEPLDVLVHCVGGFRYAPLDETSDQDLEFLLNANLRSALLLLREILPGMKQRGFGRIVLISARSTLSPSAGMSVYAATKAALNALTAALADELKAHDININAVLPSIIDTPANRKDMPKADFTKWVRPEALADIIFTLTHDLGRPIHGALIPVAGRV